jgi:predicted CoA-binding protein
MARLLSLPSAPMSDHRDRYPDDLLRAVLAGARTIAMVGASPTWSRPSHVVMKYLQAKGHRVIPVNPKAGVNEILGETCYAGLRDIPLDRTGPIDLVDIFRASAAVGPIVEDAIAIGAKVVWMQLGVRNDDAAAKAEAAGLTVIMNRCPKIEYERLRGSLT